MPEKVKINYARLPALVQMGRVTWPVGSTTSEIHTAKKFHDRNKTAHRNFMLPAACPHYLTLLLHFIAKENKNNTKKDKEAQLSTDI
jgi:hypothetical protein